MKQNFIAKAVFNDTPSLKEKCDSQEKALATISSWSKTKAGITRFEIYQPDKSKDVYDARANYKFTIPAEICKKFKLTK